jgi:predicted site-specific integrase-resolvase
MLLTPRKAAEHFNVSKQTLRRWATAGKVDYIRTKKAICDIGLMEKLIGKTTSIQEVSSSKQKDDLE